MPGGDDGACACTGDRTEQIAAMLERERERGGTVPTVDRVSDALLAPLYFRALFGEGTSDPDLPDVLLRSM